MNGLNDSIWGSLQLLRPNDLRLSEGNNAAVCGGRSTTFLRRLGSSREQIWVCLGSLLLVPDSLDFRMAHSHLGWRVMEEDMYTLCPGSKGSVQGSHSSFIFARHQVEKVDELPGITSPKEERKTACNGWKQRELAYTRNDHWSIAVKNGKALEEQWRVEISIPRGGPYRWTRVPFYLVFYSKMHTLVY